MTGSDRLNKTALYDEHLAGGGRMVPFAGFELPVLYTSLVKEHTAVRTAAGLFDVSHMGEILIRGERALDFVQKVSCNDHSKLAVGRAQYTGLMYPEGTFVDDMLVHRMAEDELMLVVNATNRVKDFAYLVDLAAEEEGVTVVDASDEYAQIALQGPLAVTILQPLVSVDLATIRYYRFVTGEVAGHRALIARTGYTGEDGFELYTAVDDAAAVWRAVLAQGRPQGLELAGLGARDTLRLEAGMHLYGNDIDATTTPLEAGLDWIVKLDKGDFIGRDVLENQREEGTQRSLVGFEMVDRGIARHGYLTYPDEEKSGEAGKVTSGTHLPTLGRAMGLAYLPVVSVQPGHEFFIDIRGRAARARVVALPFYSRKKKTKKTS